MPSNEINPVARFDWSMGSISPRSTLVREVNLEEVVDAISLETFMNLVNQREQIVAFTSSATPVTIHMYEADGLLKHLIRSKIDPNTKNLITKIYFFSVRVFEKKIVTEFISDNRDLAWLMIRALLADQECAYDAGLLLKAFGRNELAKRYFEMASDYPGALYERYRFNGDEKLLVKAAEGGSWQACNELGVRLAKKGHFPDAKERFVNTVPDGVLHYNLAQLLRKDGYLQLAEMYYQNAWDLGFTPAANNLGVMAFNRGEKDEALGYLRSAVHTKDDHARRNYARALEDVGNFQDAASQWKVLDDVESQIAALQKIGQSAEKRPRIELDFDERFFTIDEAKPLTNYVDR